MMSFHNYFLDPHFKLINGNYMSYHGQCDILLSRIDSFASGLGLEIHIRTTRVDRSINAYSYISGAAVRIGSDVVEVLESGMLLINGDDADMQLINEEEGRGYPAMTHTSLLISGFKIKSSAKGTHRRIFIHDLDLGNRNSIQIRANNLTGMLSVDLVGEEFGNSVGLLSGKIAAHPAANAYNQDTRTDHLTDPNTVNDNSVFWPPWPFSLLNKNNQIASSSSPLASKAASDFQTGAELFVAYTRQRAKLGLQQIQQG